MLIGAIELMKAEDSSEHRSMFMEELMKAEFWCPAIIEPEPKEDAEGKPQIGPGNKVQFPMLSTADGTRFYMAFTDESEYNKWVEKTTKKLPVFALTFDDYAGMVLGRGPNGNLCPALGIVINPYGANIIVPREMLAGIMSSKMSREQRPNP